MKRVGNLFGRVLERENLLDAFCKASRGKRSCPDQRAFEGDLEGEIARLREGLADGTYPVGNYLRFRIFDPKERTICAAAFGERVLHHALMNVCIPEIDRRLSPDSYACRTGKGQTAALRRAMDWCGRREWYMKGDIRKCFDSIPHEGVSGALRRIFKDSTLLWWFDRILGTYETEPGRGLPIGNLTSQWFANLYLAPLDHLSGPFVRYMDDFLLFGRTREELLDRRGKAEGAIAALGLEPKHRMCPMRTHGGVPFLGRRVREWGAVPGRKCLRRSRRREAACDVRLATGLWSQEQYRRHAIALGAARAFLPREPFRGSGPGGLRREPRPPRRELLERPAELPVGEPQQEQSGQPQQEQRLPPGGPPAQNAKMDGCFVPARLPDPRSGDRKRTPSRVPRRPPPVAESEGCGRPFAVDGSAGTPCSTKNGSPRHSACSSTRGVPEVAGKGAVRWP